MSSRTLNQGPGWRVGWDPHASEFPALIGTDDWAIELTATEFADLCRLSHQLVATMQSMMSELMDEESIVCELETECIWICAEGFPSAYSLRLILHQSRRSEGYWVAGIVFLQGLHAIEETLKI